MYSISHRGMSFCGNILSLHNYNKMLNNIIDWSTPSWFQVIILEPFFDGYESMVQMAGGVPVFVQLKQVSRNSSGLYSSLDISTFALILKDPLFIL